MAVRLEDVAASSIELEAAALNLAAGTTLIGSTFTDAAVRGGFLRQSHTVGLRQYALEGVVFDTTTCTLHHQGQIISQSTYLTEPHEQGEPNEQIDRVLTAAPGDRAVIGYNRAWANHYHWVAQALPAIDHAIRSCGDARPLCILPPVTPRQVELLRLLGHTGAKFVSLAPHQRVQMRSCQYSELLCGRAAFSVSMAARRTFDHLAAAARRETPTAPLIYVARTDSTHRRLQNEDALIGLLEPMGFRTVLPGQLSPEQQIVLFREARAVVGPHGAGMTNIAFCRPGALVYELFPRFYPNPCMNRLAQSGGLIYAADLFEGTGSVENQLHGEWTVDLDRIGRQLGELLELIVW
jgi:capsular polysaccharide biosynthesis protein